MAGRQRRPLCHHRAMHKQHKITPLPMREEHIFVKKNQNCMKRRSNRHFTQKLTAAAPRPRPVLPHPPPPPGLFPGFINEALRQDDPSMNVWDIGGALRLRYEIHEGYGVAGSPGSMDFRDHNANESNNYLLSRIRFHAGYTDKWWNA